MKPIFVIILLTIICSQSCNNSTTQQEVSTKKDSTTIAPRQENEGIKLATHLSDTTTLTGNFILFLLPDSARFASLEDEPGIYDADGDFAIGISNTIDSISKNEKYRNIEPYTTDKRYINIKDCDKCPIVIDRDTVNYGIILSSRGKKLKTEYNEVHSGDYLQSVEEYFDLQ